MTFKKEDDEETANMWLRKETYFKQCLIQTFTYYDNITNLLTSFSLVAKYI